MGGLGRRRMPPHYAIFTSCRQSAYLLPNGFPSILLALQLAELHSHSVPPSLLTNLEGMLTKHASGPKSCRYSTRRQGPVIYRASSSMVSR